MVLTSWDDPPSNQDMHRLAQRVLLGRMVAAGLFVPWALDFRCASEKGSPLGFSMVFSYTKRGARLNHLNPRILKITGVVR